jgi:hypothetical protein
MGFSEKRKPAKFINSAGSFKKQMLTYVPIFEE